MKAALDRDALLAALVLAPATYSRNRFFDLHADPEVRRIRRRASQIRGVVRHVTRASAADRSVIIWLSRWTALESCACLAALH